MIKYTTTRLQNGLTLIIHENRTSPLALVNVLYKAGSAHENPQKTGYAHLLEHIMFCGSENIDDFDYIVQKAGGNNNAFTTSDYTNYYINLPADNIETAFWLESDRMRFAGFKEESVLVQKQVVIEEFKEGYINQPYGDIWHLISELAYKKHPYRWPTIGLSVEHIEEATVNDLKSFYNKFYQPQNAILSISSPLITDKVIRMAEKWFGSLKNTSESPVVNLPAEPVQENARFLEVEREVPADMIIKSFHMDKRLSEEYYFGDILTDILSQGQSARLHERLVKQENIFSHIDAYVTGTNDPGQIIIEARLSDGISFKEADAKINKELEEIATAGPGEKEVKKADNQKRTQLAFNNQNMFEKTFQLAYFEMLDSAERINREMEIYKEIKPQDIKTTAEKVFEERNSSTIFYKAKN